MQLALECPTKLLGQIQPFADIDFMLTHLVLQDESYRKFYTSSEKAKFLDNSVNELGTPASLEEIQKAYELVKGRYPLNVISPDFLGDVDKTVSAFVEALKLFQPLGQSVVPVLQGSTYEEAFMCLSAYIRVHNNSANFLLAVPYDICSTKEDPPELMSLRRALIVSNFPPPLQVHLLGFTSVEELFWYRGKSQIVSIDTGVPVLQGLRGKGIEDSIESKKEPSLKLMEDLPLTKDGYSNICRNLALLRTYM